MCGPDRPAAQPHQRRPVSPALYHRTRARTRKLDVCTACWSQDCRWRVLYVRGVIPRTRRARRTQSRDREPHSLGRDGRFGARVRACDQATGQDTAVRGRVRGRQGWTVRDNERPGHRREVRAESGAGRRAGSGPGSGSEPRVHHRDRSGRGTPGGVDVHGRAVRSAECESHKRGHARAKQRRFDVRAPLSRPAGERRLVRRRRQGRRLRRTECREQARAHADRGGERQPQPTGRPGADRALPPVPLGRAH